MDAVSIEPGSGLSYTNTVVLLSVLFGLISLMVSYSLFAGLGGFGKNKFIVDERVCIVQKNP